MKKIQLSIPTPCHEKWENMTQVEKARPDDPFGRGKFCDSCQKKVIDFSLMSDREIAMFFKKPSLSLSKGGSVCGRFMDDQLNKDIEIPRKRIPWVKYFFRFALPAFLISMKASGQKEKPLMGKVASTSVRSLIGDTTFLRMDKEPLAEDSIKGKIVDPKGNPIPFATAIIKGTNIGTRANASGEFTLHIKQNIKGITIVASAIGYLAQELMLSDNPNLIKRPIVLKLGNQWLGEVVVTAGYVVCKRVPEKKKDTANAVPKIQSIKKLEDNTAKIFKLYPNPVHSGSSVNIRWKQSETGYFTLQLFNLAGQIVFNKEMWVDGKGAILKFELPNVAPGNYIVRMTSKQTAKVFSEKIIIQ